MHPVHGVVLSPQLGSLIYLSNNIIPQDEVTVAYFYVLRFSKRVHFDSSAVFIHLTFK